ncbi:MAG: 4'-phosphopantetheinyl transferase superfamily protein [Hyphomicrobiales bacterium]|nr:4'-phosphopantetheinyl transferase superfamily protein [Hyphomicrobiales bacterium]
MSKTEMSVDPLAALIRSLAKPGIHLGYRFVAEGDEQSLTPAEAEPFLHADVTVRRGSGAARIVARALLERFHCPGATIAKAASGAPIWPAGIVGSLAHDHSVAVAAVARAADVSCLGIDIEAAEPLPDELVDLVSTPAERVRYGRMLLQDRRLFVAKEAVYKAVHPVDGIFLDFGDVEIDFERREARTSYGRRVVLDIAIASHVVALAYMCSRHSSIE